MLPWRRRNNQESRQAGRQAGRQPGIEASLCIAVVIVSPSVVEVRMGDGSDAFLVLQHRAFNAVITELQNKDAMQKDARQRLHGFSDMDGWTLPGISPKAQRANKIPHYVEMHRWQLSRRCLGSTQSILFGIFGSATRI